MNNIIRGVHRQVNEILVKKLSKMVYSSKDAGRINKIHNIRVEIYDLIYRKLHEKINEGIKKI